MASAKPFLAEGPNSNRPPCFTGDHYDFWKIRMTTYLEAQGEEIWDAVKNGPYVPTTTVNGVTSIKPQTSWDDGDRKKMLFDKKAKNILQSSLGMDEFFRISKCKTAKEIWDTLETTHEENEECANLTLMASHHSDDEENEVSDSELNYKYSYEELQNAFNELYEECINLSKTCAKQKKQIVSLERKAFDAQVELEKVKSSSCNKCKEIGRAHV